MSKQYEVRKTINGNLITFAVLNSLTGSIQSVWNTLGDARRVAYDLNRMVA